MVQSYGRMSLRLCSRLMTYLATMIDMGICFNCNYFIPDFEVITDEW